MKNTDKIDKDKEKIKSQWMAYYAAWRDLRKDKRLKMPDKLLMVEIQDGIGANGFIWKSYQTLADNIGVSRRTVIRSIKQLVAFGHLTKAKRKPRQSNYLIINFALLPPKTDMIQSDIDVRLTSDNVSPHGDNVSLPLVTDCHPNVLSTNVLNKEETINGIKVFNKTLILSKKNIEEKSTFDGSPSVTGRPPGPDRSPKVDPSMEVGADPAPLKMAAAPPPPIVATEVLVYFLQTYFIETGKVHPELTEDQKFDVVKRIEEFTEEKVLSFEQWKTMVDHWFHRKFETDYRIYHFISGEIFDNLFWEAIY